MIPSLIQIFWIIEDKKEDLVVLMVEHSIGKDTDWRIVLIPFIVVFKKWEW